MEKLKSLFYFKIIQKHGKLHFRTIKNIVNFVSKNIHPKCNKKSDIGKFVIKFGNFCLYLGKNRGRLPAPNLA